MGCATDGSADHLIAVHRHDSLIFLAAGEHLRKAVDRLNLEGGELFPEMQNAVEIVRVKVADAPYRQCDSLG